MESLKTLEYFLAREKDNNSRGVFRCVPEIGCKECCKDCGASYYQKKIDELNSKAK